MLKPKIFNYTWNEIMHRTHQLQCRIYCQWETVLYYCDRQRIDNNIEFNVVYVANTTKLLNKTKLINTEIISSPLLVV